MPEPITINRARNRDPDVRAPAPSWGKVLPALRARVGEIEGGYGDPGLRWHVPTGIEPLDAVLPGGGLPAGALTECFGESGDGRLSFTLALLGRLLGADVEEEEPEEERGRGRGRRGRRGGDHGEGVAMLVDPRGELFAPALAQAGLPLSRLLHVRPRKPQDTLWAIEQSLLCGGLVALVAFIERLDVTALRRLQLAAEAGGTLALLMRPVAELGRRAAGAVQLLFRAQPVGGAGNPACQVAMGGAGNPACPDGPTRMSTPPAKPPAYTSDAMGGAGNPACQDGPTRMSAPPAEVSAPPAEVSAPPAEVSAPLSALARGTRVEVVRCRGGLPGGCVDLVFEPAGGGGAGIPACPAGPTRMLAPPTRDVPDGDLDTRSPVTATASINAGTVAGARALAPIFAAAARSFRPAVRVRAAAAVLNRAGAPRAAAGGNAGA